MLRTFQRRYSHSALFGYAFVIFLLTPLAICGHIELKRMVAAISVGGFFIILGDLLSLSYYLLGRRYNDRKELRKIYDIVNEFSNLHNHHNNGEKTIDWLKKKIDEVELDQAYCERKLKGENIARFVGFVSTTIGFSSLLLLLTLDRPYYLSETTQAYMTIISFFFLTMTLIREEMEDNPLEKIKKDKEIAIKIAGGTLSPKEHNDKEETSFFNEIEQ